MGYKNLVSKTKQLFLSMFRKLKKGHFKNKIFPSKNRTLTLCPNQFKKPSQMSSISPSESGKSMVEIIGVLIIIGVVTLTALLGYDQAMLMYRENETLDQYAKAVAGARTGFILEEFGDKTVSGGSYEAVRVPIRKIISAVQFDEGSESFTTPMGAQVFVDVETPDAFTAHIKGTTYNVCRKIVAADLGYDFAYKDTKGHNYYPIVLQNNKEIAEEFCRSVAPFEDEEMAVSEGSDLVLWFGAFGSSNGSCPACYIYKDGICERKSPAPIGCQCTQDSDCNSACATCQDGQCTETSTALENCEKTCENGNQIECGGICCPLGISSCAGENKDKCAEPDVSCPAGEILMSNGECCPEDYYNIATQECFYRDCPSGQVLTIQGDCCPIDSYSPITRTCLSDLCADDEILMLGGWCCPIQWYDFQSGECLQASPCPDGQILTSDGICCDPADYNSQTGKCEDPWGIGTVGCPEGYHYDELYDKCCPEGQHYSDEYKRCCWNEQPENSTTCTEKTACRKGMVANEYPGYGRQDCCLKGNAADHSPTGEAMNVCCVIFGDRNIAELEVPYPHPDGGTRCCPTSQQYKDDFGKRGCCWDGVWAETSSECCPREDFHSSSKLCCPMDRYVITVNNGVAYEPKPNEVKCCPEGYKAAKGAHEKFGEDTKTECCPEKDFNAETIQCCAQGEIFIAGDPKSTEANGPEGECCPTDRVNHLRPTEAEEKLTCCPAGTKVTQKYKDDSNDFVCCPVKEGVSMSSDDGCCKDGEEWITTDSDEEDVGLCCTEERLNNTVFPYECCAEDERFAEADGRCCSASDYNASTKSCCPTGSVWISSDVSDGENATGGECCPQDRVSPEGLLPRVCCAEGERWVVQNSSGSYLEG